MSIVLCLVRWVFSIQNACYLDDTCVCGCVKVGLCARATSFLWVVLKEGLLFFLRKKYEYNSLLLSFSQDLFCLSLYAHKRMKKKDERQKQKRKEKTGKRGNICKHFFDFPLVPYPSISDSFHTQSKITAVLPNFLFDDIWFGGFDHKCD